MIITVDTAKLNIDLLSSDAKTKLGSIKESDFTNPLEYCYNKAQLEAYISEVGSAVVALSNIGDVEKYTVMANKDIHERIKAYTKERGKLPKSDEVYTNDKDAENRGKINGIIAALKDILTIVTWLSGQLAKNLAIKLGKDKID